MNSLSIPLSLKQTQLYRDFWLSGSWHPLILAFFKGLLSLKSYSTYILVSGFFCSMSCWWNHPYFCVYLLIVHTHQHGEGNGNLLQYSCLGKSHGQRSLVGYRPWGHKELDTTEHIHAYSSVFCVSQTHRETRQRDWIQIWSNLWIQLSTCRKHRGKNLPISQSHTLVMDHFRHVPANSS